MYVYICVCGVYICIRVRDRYRYRYRHTEDTWLYIPNMFLSYLPPLLFKYKIAMKKQLKFWSEKILTPLLCNGKCLPWEVRFRKAQSKQ